MATLSASLYSGNRLLGSTTELNGYRASSGPPVVEMATAAAFPVDGIFPVQEIINVRSICALLGHTKPIPGLILTFEKLRGMVIVTCTPLALLETVKVSSRRVKGLYTCCFAVARTSTV